MPLAARRRFGAALLAFCIAAAAMLAMAATSILLETSGRALQSAGERHRTQALYAAEAGVETALVILNQRNGRLPRRLSGTCGDATWELVVSPDPAVLISTGVSRPRAGGIARCDLYVRIATVGGRCRVVQWQWPPPCPPPWWTMGPPMTPERRGEGAP